MDQTDDIINEQTELKAQRQHLRALADQMLAALEAMPKPQSFIDIARALRAVMIADRVLVQLYSPPKVPATRRTIPAIHAETPKPTADARPMPVGPVSAKAPPMPAPPLVKAPLVKATLDTLPERPFTARNAQAPLRSETALPTLASIIGPPSGLQATPLVFTPP